MTTAAAPMPSRRRFPQQLPATDAAAPHDLAAERAVLGAVLINNDLTAEVLRRLTPDAFYRLGHRRIFEAIQRLAARGAAIDTLTLRAELEHTGYLEDAGGPACIAGLVDGVPKSTNVEHYARVVTERALERTVDRLYTITRAQIRDGDLPSAAFGRFSDEIRGLASPCEATDLDRVLVDDAALMRWTAAPSLVAGRLSQGALAVLYGQPGEGKSFVALDLALCLATRQPWLGAAVLTSGPTIFVVAEGVWSFPPRVHAWKASRGFALDEALGLHTYPRAVNLMDAADVGRFLEVVRPQGAVAIVLDTFARCLVGGDENSARDVGLAIAQCDRIRTETGALVLLVHHARKDGASERGSGALRGAADMMMALTKADDLLTLSCEKSKDSSPFEPIELRLVHESDAGSCYILEAHQHEPEVNTPLTEGQARLLRALQDSFQTEGATAAEWEAATPGVPRATFYRARAVLLKRGLVVKRGPRFNATVSSPHSQGALL
jgi:hypothetical protein